MPINNVLARLNKVKQTGRNKWLACCPAHDDSNPSLSIKETDSRIVLLKCWAGCDNSEILQAIGMEYADLYPSASAFHLPPVRKPWNASDVLNALAFEVMLAWNYANILANGGTLTATDSNRLMLCAGRLNSGLEVING